MVTVKQAMAAFQKALDELSEQDPDAEVVGNFDQGGYVDVAFDVERMTFDICDSGDGRVVVVAEFYEED